MEQIEKHVGRRAVKLEEGVKVLAETEEEEEDRERLTQPKTTCTLVLIRDDRRNGFEDVHTSIAYRDSYKTDKHVL